LFPFLTELKSEIGRIQDLSSPLGISTTCFPVSSIVKYRESTQQQQKKEIQIINAINYMILNRFA